MKEPVFFVRDPFSWWILYLILLLLLFSCVNFQCSKRIKEGTSGFRHWSSIPLTSHRCDTRNSTMNTSDTPSKTNMDTPNSHVLKGDTSSKSSVRLSMLVFNGVGCLKKIDVPKKIIWSCSLQADVALQKRALAQKKWKKPTWVWSWWDENDFMDERNLSSSSSKSRFHVLNILSSLNL